MSLSPKGLDETLALQRWHCHRAGPREWDASWIDNRTLQKDAAMGLANHGLGFIICELRLMLCHHCLSTLAPKDTALKL
jgi:hypothetical protein